MAEWPNALGYCRSHGLKTADCEFLRFLWPLWYWTLCGIAKPTKFRTLETCIRAPTLLLISCVTLSTLLGLCPSVCAVCGLGPTTFFLGPSLCRAVMKTFTHLKKNELGPGQSFSTFTCHTALGHPWQLVLPVNFNCHSCLGRPPLTTLREQIRMKWERTALL